MTGSAALYQVAIALIPALLFGGATLQLREEGPSLTSGALVGVILAFVLAGGVLAEIVAIRGAIDPAISAWEQRYLVLVLTLGTVAVVYWFAAPLLTDQNGKDHVRHGRLVLAGLLIGAAGLGQLTITDSLRHSEARTRFEEASERRLLTLRELRTAETEDFRARSRLIVLARSLRASDAVVKVVVGQLGHLDDTVLSLARDEDVDMFNVDRVMIRAVTILNAVDDALEGSFKDGIRGLDKGERELLLLAERQLISAVSLEATSKVNDTLAAQNLERACADADFLHCAAPPVRGRIVDAVAREDAGRR